MPDGEPLHDTRLHLVLRESDDLLRRRRDVALEQRPEAFNRIEVPAVARPERLRPPAEADVVPLVALEPLLRVVRRVDGRAVLHERPPPSVASQ